MKAMLPNHGCAGALLTDLYQLTMAYGYWKAGKADQEAVFELFFRKPPFQCGFTVAAGLAPAIDFLGAFCFTDDDAAFLGTLRGNDNQPLFDGKFLDYLKALRFTCDVHAIPEGTVVFPQEPLLRIQGPILQCQLLETAMLNLINFQSLVATKAARVCLAAQGESVLEFGLRRAQGVDGALAASRAAFIGGCDATSNVLAGKLYGIPVRGTHAHSWVMSFDDEREAFRTYAEAMPNNCVFLVDTYDTLEGVRRAVEVGRWLREHGHEMSGIRLDSGDLAWLSIEARKILDEGGFPKAVIVASNDLDEHIIASLKDQGALLAEISRDFPDSDLFGIDLSSEFASRFLERQRAGEFGGAYIHFFHRNLFDRIFEPESIDTTLCNSTLHEIWSYGDGEKSVRSYLAEKLRQLRPGGRLLIRDVVGPDDGKREVLLWCSDADGQNLSTTEMAQHKDRSAAWLHKLSTRRRFCLFAKDFRGGRSGFSFKEKSLRNRPMFRLTLRQAAEFLSKKDYIDNWSSEMNEEFCFWDFPKWKQVLTEIGFQIFENPNHPAEGSRVYTNSWIVKNRHVGHVEIADLNGEALPWPPTNMVLVAEKPAH